MAKRSSYQDRAIRNYYENLDLILVQRLGDLVSDLYLSQGTQRTRLWKRVSDTLTKLKIPADQVQHIVGSDNPQLVADILKRLLEKK